MLRSDTGFSNHLIMAASQAPSMRPRLGLRFGRKLTAAAAAATAVSMGSLVMAPWCAPIGRAAAAQVERSFDITTKAAARTGHRRWSALRQQETAGLLSFRSVAASMALLYASSLKDAAVWPFVVLPSFATIGEELLEPYTNILQRNGFLADCGTRTIVTV